MPASIWMALITPQVPLMRSKENVPWPPTGGWPGLAPMSSWTRAASAGSPRLSSRYRPVLIRMSTSPGSRPACARQAAAAVSARRRAFGFRTP